MAAALIVADVQDYLSGAGLSSAWSEAEIEVALIAESKAQSRRCSVPTGSTGWDEDLLEALKRRVLRNLAMRRLPLGISESEVSGTATRLGATDPEIRRLEAYFLRMGAF